MAFGQSSGPAATGKQLRELLELLAAAGHSDFRDARGPMGFTQRQAGGKFTRDEAEELIELLESEDHSGGPPTGSGPPRSSKAASPRSSKIAPRRQVSGSSSSSKSHAKVALDGVPVELLVAELERRGWTVLEPQSPS